MARFAVVEPSEADCLYRNAAAGRLPWAARIDPDGRPGRSRRLAVDAMDALADDDGDVPIVAGQSTGAAMVGLLTAPHDAALRGR